MPNNNTSYSFNVDTLMEHFCGDDTLHIKTWLKDFEKNSAIYGWCEEWKLIYCRKLLGGPAKKFIDTKIRPYSYRETKDALIEEFGSIVIPVPVPVTVAVNHSRIEPISILSTLDKDQTTSEFLNWLNNWFKNTFGRKTTAALTENDSESDTEDSTDSEEAEEENAPIPFIITTKCTSKHEGKQMLRRVFPTNIENLFNLLFSKSKFLVDFHHERKGKNTNYGEWTVGERGLKTRIITLTVTLTGIYKSADITENQVMRNESKPGELYSIDICNVSAGVPYADSFRVNRHYCLMRTPDDHTELSVHAELEFIKSVWFFKSTIESKTWTGLEEYYQALLLGLEKIPPAKPELKPKVPKVPKAKKPKIHKVKKVTPDKSDISYDASLILRNKLVFILFTLIAIILHFYYF